MAAAREIHLTIAEAYTAHCNTERDAAVTVNSPVFRAQGMNNAIFWNHIKGIQRAVDDRRDYERCAAEIIEATEMLATLRQAWLDRLP